MSQCIITFLFIFIASTTAQIDSACQHPLGMQDKRISDFYVTASSSYSLGLAARYARLNRDEGDGAWCPLGNIEPGSEEEFLQIQLPSLSFITAIATQGRYSSGKGREFTTTYKIKFSRDGSDWQTWYNPQDVSSLSGNSDTHTVRKQSLFPPIAGVKYIRIVPVSNRPTPVCLRAELYGCLWKSGLTSYNIPTPDDFQSISSDTKYSDDTYDGAQRSTSFFDGLGQLSDGVIGSDNLFQTNSRVRTNAKGYDYVAWTVGEGEEIEMMFLFDVLRNFTSMTIHCYVDQNVDASLFTIVHIYPSTDRVSFPSLPIASFNNRLGENDAHARTFNLPFESLNLVAVALKVVFQVPGGKLMLSEVQFYSTLIPKNLVNRYTDDPPWETENIPGEDDNLITVKTTKSPVDVGPQGDNTGVIIGVLIGVIVLLALIVAALFYRQRKLRKTLIPPSFRFHNSDPADPLVLLAPRISTDKEETKSPIYHEISPAAPDNIYHVPKDALDRIPPPPYQANSDVPSAAEFNQANTEPSHYAESNLFAQQLFTQSLQGVSGNNIYAVPWSTPSPKSRKRKIKSKRLNNFPNLHGSNNNSKSLMDERKNLLSKLHSDEMPPEFPRSKLQFVEKLGEGQFGEVHLCKADPLIRELEDDYEFTLPGASDSPVLVAVKVLRDNASRDAKEDFFKEVRVMSRLLHPNIVRLLAVCTDDQPFAMVTEYMEHGDLNQYLQSFDDELQPAPGKKVIKTETLVKIAVQIASGLDYLSSLNFVHRDLATRNCLVGNNNDIRIGDFGMSRNMYQSDYYRIQGKAVLPIRWMAWECILLGKFSIASDVWAFGVTLWEIYSVCKQQPFAAMTDEQVIDNLRHVHQNTKKETQLPRPKRCPTTMYNMMRQCWKKEPNDRPTSSQLLSFLLERQHTNRQTSKPKRPQGKPPAPKA